MSGAGRRGSADAWPDRVGGTSLTSRAGLWGAPTCLSMVKQCRRSCACGQSLSRGFTLSILAAIAVPLYANVQQRARIAKAQAAVGLERVLADVEHDVGRVRDFGERRRDNGEPAVTQSARL
jgi:hypothetical protein